MLNKYSSFLIYLSALHYSRYRITEHGKEDSIRLDSKYQFDGYLICSISSNMKFGSNQVQLKCLLRLYIIKFPAQEVKTHRA